MMSTFLLVSSSITLLIVGLVTWQVLNMRRLPEWVTVWIKVPLLAISVMIALIALVTQSLILQALTHFFG